MEEISSIWNQKRLQLYSIPVMLMAPVMLSVTFLLQIVPPWTPNLSIPVTAISGSGLLHHVLMKVVMVIITKIVISGESVLSVNC